MKICCYEKFITVSSGTAYRSAVRDTRWGSLPGPGATVRALAAVGRRREGQVPCALYPSSGDSRSPAAGRVAFDRFPGQAATWRSGCASEGAFFSARCSLGRRGGDGARSLSPAAPRRRSAGASCWCPFSRCVADLGSWLSCRAGSETPAPSAEVLMRGGCLLI